jgi:hypothetical protein
MNQYKDKLYVKDQLGKIREWYLHYDNIKYIKHYGVLNGETITSTTIINEGKNIGKSNETSIQQQVLKECESEYKHQKKLGYKELPNEIKYSSDAAQPYKWLNDNLLSNKTDENNYLKPMKAQKYQIGCMKLPCLGQAKINGVRATISLNNKSNGLFGTMLEAQIKSKEGLIYDIPHIEKEALELLKNYPELILDGEIYISGEHVTSIGGAARNPNNPLNSKLGFVVFDLSIPILSQEERTKQLENIFTGKNINIMQFCELNIQREIHSKIFIIPTFELFTENQITDWRNTFIDYKFEGLILRDKEADYKFGSRAKTMRKFKLKDDAEFIILDIVAGDKDGKTIFICKNDINDLTFRVDGTKEYLDIKFIEHAEDYIGRKATIEFFERTINQLPFHTTLIGIRDYE